MVLLQKPKHDEPEYSGDDDEDLQIIEPSPIELRPPPKLKKERIAELEDALQIQDKQYESLTDQIHILTDQIAKQDQKIADLQSNNLQTMKTKLQDLRIRISRLKMNGHIGIMADIDNILGLL
jgi:chromosome segregation ATPase